MDPLPKEPVDVALTVYDFERLMIP
jgi:hypothetical protein